MKKRKYLSGEEVNLSCSLDLKIWRRFKSIYGYLGRFKKESIQEALELFIQKYEMQLQNGDSITYESKHKHHK